MGWDRMGWMDGVRMSSIVGMNKMGWDGMGWDGWMDGWD